MKEFRPEESGIHGDMMGFVSRSHTQSQQEQSLATDRPVETVHDIGTIGVTTETRVVPIWNDGGGFDQTVIVPADFVSALDLPG